MTASSEDRSARPLSPCISVCTLDEDKICLGCGRSMQQISAWARMSVAQQWEVIDDLAAHRTKKLDTIVAETVSD